MREWRRFRGAYASVGALAVAVAVWVIGDQDRSPSLQPGTAPGIVPPGEITSDHGQPSSLSTREARPIPPAPAADPAPTTTTRAEAKQELVLPSGASSVVDVPTTASPDGETLEKEFRMGQGGTITGRTVERESGKPLAGVPVVVKTTTAPHEVRSTPAFASARTNADAIFYIENIPETKCLVEFNPEPPLLSQAKMVNVTHGHTADLGDIPLESGVTIRGRVVRAPDDAGLPGLHIQVRDSQGGRLFAADVETDARGEFRIDLVPRARYSLGIQELNLHQIFEVGDGNEKEVLIRVGQSGMRGTVLRAGQPCRARVSLTHVQTSRSASAETDAEGRYEITGMPAGKCHASVLALGVGTQWSETMQPVTLPEGGFVEKNFVVPAAQMLGRVLDAEGNPVQQATVIARVVQQSQFANPPRREPSAYSGADGSFSISDLAGGTYDVSASKKDEGFARVQGVVVPDDGDSEPVVLRFGSPDSGTVISFVHDPTGKPIPAASCHLVDPKAGALRLDARRDADGILVLRDIPAGSYVMSIDAKGYTSLWREIQVAPDDTLEFEDTLLEAGGLEWTLVGGEGNPLAHVPCRLVPANPGASPESFRTGMTGKTGVFALNDLIPGDYTATATLPDRRTVTESFTIQVRQQIARTTRVE